MPNLPPRYLRLPREVPEPPALHLTAHEAAARVGATVDAVRDWLTLGITVRTSTGKKRIALRGRKVGKRWQIAPEDLDAFVKATTDAALCPDVLPPSGGETPTQAAARWRAEQQEARRRLSPWETD